MVFSARRSRLAALASTPARLRLVSLLLVGGILTLWVVLVAFAAQRQAVASRALDRDGPQLVRAQELYRVLADADATASRTFLEPVDSPELRRRYLADLDRAGALVTEMGVEGGHGDWEQHLGRVTQGLSTYAGRVEVSRANSRLGFPVAAAYLRQASATMSDDLLPEVTQLYAMAAADLDESGRKATAAGPWVALAVVGTAVVAVALVAQWWLARRTRRIVNVGLATMSAVVVVALALTSWLLVDGQRSLVRAQEQGSDVVQLLASTRILTLRAHTDASFTLIERGTGADFVRDFKDMVNRLGVPVDTIQVLGEPIPHPVSGPPTGLLAELHDLGSYDAGPTEALMREWLGAHEAVRTDDATGRYDTAVSGFLGYEVQAAERLDDHLDASIGAAQVEFTASAGDARDRAEPVGILATVALVVALAAVALGLRPRLREYR